MRIKTCKYVICKLLWCTAGFIMFPAAALAVVYGGSNLGLDGYPSNTCIKPEKPYKPYSFDSQLEIDIYNNQVDEYNSDFEQYITCIKDYLENADNDVLRIKEKEQEAIDDARN